MKTAYYLVIMDGIKPLDIKSLSDMIDDRHLSFASADRMKVQLDTNPGMVSVFALINNKEHNVTVVIDQELMNREYITFHPNINTVTIQISIDDMKRFLEAAGNPVRFLRLP